VAPILALNLKCSDRLILAEELKNSTIPCYTPSTEVETFLKKS